MSAFTFSAAVLCGGHSTRMGADKAHLPAPDSGAPLLLHQLATLASLAPPPAARLVAARAGQPLPPLPSDVQRRNDDGNSGPLGALVALLTDLATSHLLVIPVDAPHLDHPTLTALLDHALRAPDRATVATSPSGTQPLVAVYARTLAPTFARALIAGRLGLRRLLLSPEIAPHLDLLPFDTDLPFTNWNTPNDLPKFPRPSA